MAIKLQFVKIRESLLLSKILESRSFEPWRQVLLANTIIRDLPRLRDAEAISRDNCHGAQARWYRGSYEGILQRSYA
jgi:hypothetical protein